MHAITSVAVGTALGAITASHHRLPTGGLLVVLVLLALLYLGWRTGRLGGLRRYLHARRAGGGGLWPEGVRIGPLALLPTALLLIVVLLLVLR